MFISVCTTKICGFAKPYAVVDMFCGEAAISKSFRRAGLPALALDVTKDVRDVPWLQRNQAKNPYLNLCSNPTNPYAKTLYPYI